MGGRGVRIPQPFKPSLCIEASFHIPENRLNFPTTRGFRSKISMKLVCQYMVIFFNFPPISNHLHPPQVVNCDSNSRLVVDEDDYGKFRLERVKLQISKKKHLVDYRCRICRNFTSPHIREFSGKEIQRKNCCFIKRGYLIPTSQMHISNHT